MKLGLFFVLSMFLLSCNPSIEATCEDIAEMQCNKCESCSDDDKRSLTLCDVRSDCIETLIGRCNDKSAVLPHPKEDLEKCEEDLSSLTCGTLYLGEAQDHPNSVSSCVPFF